MEPLTDEDKDLLRRAAEEILRRGYTREVYFDDTYPAEDCAVCAVGAMAAAAVAAPDSASLATGLDFILFTDHGGRLLEAVADTIPATIPAGWLHVSEDRITSWNDEEGRTAEEVAELFLNVADNY